MRTTFLSISLFMSTAIMVAGCSSKGQQALDPPQATDSRPEDPPAPGGRDTMGPGFQKAYASFTDHAAKVLGVSRDAVKVLPFDEAVANLPHQGRLGTLWQLETAVNDRTVRGWAAPDGTVVMYQQNLGLFLEQAGIWTASPKLTPMELAERLVWSMGPEHRLIVEELPNNPAPELQLAADGTGTMMFVVGRRQLGPGGAGGGPEFLADAKLVLTGDHRAELSLGAWRGR
jgi:hypothetical protein